jgi:hypothetical protein
VGGGWRSPDMLLLVLLGLLFADIFNFGRPTSFTVRHQVSEECKIRRVYSLIIQHVKASVRYGKTKHSELRN